MRAKVVVVVVLRRGAPQKASTGNAAEHLRHNVDDSAERRDVARDVKGGGD